MKNDRFEVLTSILIAIVTICGALTAWRASAASIEAGNADFDGLSSSIRAQEERLRNSVQAYEHLRAFTSYFRYNELGRQIQADGTQNVDLEETELFGVSLGLQYTFFQSRYLDREGNYDVQRELDELWAESNAQKDLNPSPHFERGDSYRDKAGLMTASIIVFAVSFFFLALAQASNHFFRWVFASLGLIALLGGMCAVLVFEFAV